MECYRIAVATGDARLADPCGVKTFEAVSLEAGHHACRLNPVEAAVTHQPTDNRAVLLLNERLVVLFVGARARHLELLFAAPGDDHVAHERAARGTGPVSI